MSLKSLIELMDKLNSEIVSEGTKDTKTGRVHTAEPGGYGRKDDEDESGKKVQSQEKRGRGRPKKDSTPDGEGGPKFSDAAKEFFGVPKKDFDPKKLPGKASVKHKIKDESIEESEGVAEATKETPTGRIHRAEPGGYGRRDDEDDEGKKVQQQVKRGRGRPKKHADSDTGEVKKWDTDKLASWMIGNKPKTLPGKPGVKHKLKDWMNHVEKSMIVESIVKESRMGKVHMVLQDIVNGNSDLYDVMNHPRDESQKAASNILHQMYDEIAGEHGLHADDDVEEIQARLMTDLESKFGETLDEVALDPSQVAVPQIKATGTQTMPTTSSTAAGKPGMGASVVDFKDPNDPLKQALQKAVQNKEVTVMSESKQLNEGALNEILENYPHEHKACQEGWGMDQSFFEALCDHYYREGRIPRKVWHGSMEELRAHVEECYMQDTKPLMDEGIEGAVVGRMAGQALAPQIAPISGAIGGALGSMAQDAMQEDLSADQKKKFFNELDAMHTAKHEEVEAVEEGTGVTDYAPKSQGGTRKELLAKYQKSKNPKDAEAARKAGATQKELQGEEFESVEEELKGNMHPGAKKVLKHIKPEHHDKLDEVAPEGWEGTVKAMKKHKDIDNPWALAHWMKGKGMKSHKKESVGDVQMESWDKQLSDLINEGMTVTTSTGNQGAADSVSVSATDADAQDLMKILQHSGLLHGKSQSMSAPASDAEMPAAAVEPVSSDEVMGVLEPQGDDRGDGAMSFLKRMLGARGSDQAGADSEKEETDEGILGTVGGAMAGMALGGPLGAAVGAVGGQEATKGGSALVEKDEACPECGHEDCECDHEEVDEMHNQTASSGDSNMSPVPEGEMEEGNMFTGNLAKARAAGKEEADLDGDGDMEKVREELKGGQHKLDVDGDGKLEKSDFAKLRAKKGHNVKEAHAHPEDFAEAEELDEEALDQPATMEAEERCDECGMMESKCGCDHDEEKLDEWANSPAGGSEDEQFLADISYMTKTISGGLNNIKQDQTTVPSARVKTEVRNPEQSMAEMIRKLQNIN